jgi:hypothetical protein
VTTSGVAVPASLWYKNQPLSLISFLDVPMDLPRLSKQVKRITVFERDMTGSLRPIVVFNRQRRKKKKQARALRPIERLVRTMSDGNDSFAGAYARRHRKSNRKSRNGWLRDFPLNLSRAANKGLKQYDFVRLARG